MQRNPKNILVTGGAGFIGSAFIRYLLSSEADFQGTCINFDALTYAGNLDNLRSVESDPRYVFVHGNIQDTTLLEKLYQEYQIDTVIHFAAESHVDRSIVGPEAFIETNVMGTFHLLETIRKHPSIHFHHVSTDEVYGSLGEKGLFTEESPYQPNSPYSASKAASDHLVRAYHHTYHLSACISNCSNNYGPFHFPEKLIPVMILNCLERKSLPIYGSGIHVRDWLHVEDHAKALYILIKQGKSGETYNIGGESERRNIDLVNEIIQIISEIENVTLEELQQLITHVKDRKGHDLRYAIDCSKMKREFNWTPQKQFSEGLKETILWYIHNQDWVRNVQSGAYREWVDLNYSCR
ncbi:MAG: dTDP-glucose 4,6-dehydratase [Parachlamydiaceae bacterium]|nr:dTDP-glucose 4,6-dehydratase [Parachlamydiaceae bacterium]